MADTVSTALDSQRALKYADNGDTTYSLSVATIEKKGTHNITLSTPGAVTPLVIAFANPSRKKLTIYNTAAQIMYIYQTINFDTTIGIPIAASTGIYIDTNYTGAWYGLSASGTGNLRIDEVT